MSVVGIGSTAGGVGMSEANYLWAVMLVMAIMTFATRLFPFVALKNKGEHPVFLFLGRYMPPAIMTILVIYSLKSVDFLHAPFGANELMALGVTVLLHLWRSHALLSIFSGTAVYMVLVQSAFL